MKRKSLNEKEIGTIYGVFDRLTSLPYDELNGHLGLGSITIKQMVELNHKLEQWYRTEVLHHQQDEDGRWIAYDEDEIFAPVDDTGDYDDDFDFYPDGDRYSWERNEDDEFIPTATDRHPLRPVEY